MAQKFDLTSPEARAAIREEAERVIQDQLIEEHRLLKREDAGVFECLRRVDLRFVELHGYISPRDGRTRQVCRCDPAAVELPRNIEPAELVRLEPGDMNIAGNANWRGPLSPEEVGDRPVLQDVFAVGGYVTRLKAERETEKRKATADRTLAESRKELSRLERRLAEEEAASREAAELLVAVRDHVEESFAGKSAAWRAACEARVEQAERVTAEEETRFAESRAAR